MDLEGWKQYDGSELVPVEPGMIDIFIHPRYADKPPAFFTFNQLTRMIGKGTVIVMIPNKQQQDENPS